MIDTDTSEAAAELRSLFRSNQGKQVATSMWDQLDGRVAQMFPPWYRLLIAEYGICDVGLYCDHEQAPSAELWLTDTTIIPGTEDDFVSFHFGNACLLESEFFPIAYTDNGDIYACERELPSEVGLLEPDWDGSSQFIARLAKSPRWESASHFLATLWPADDYHEPLIDEQGGGGQAATRAEST